MVDLLISCVITQRCLEKDAGPTSCAPGHDRLRESNFFDSYDLGMAAQPFLQSGNGCPAVPTIWERLSPTTWDRMPCRAFMTVCQGDGRSMSRNHLTDSCSASEHFTEILGTMIQCSVLQKIKKSSESIFTFNKNSVFTAAKINSEFRIRMQQVFGVHYCPQFCL